MIAVLVIRCIRCIRSPLVRRDEGGQWTGQSIYCGCHGNPGPHRGAPAPLTSSNPPDLSPKPPESL